MASQAPSPRIGSARSQSVALPADSRFGPKSPLVDFGGILPRMSSRRRSEPRFGLAWVLVVLGGCVSAPPATASSAVDESKEAASGSVLQWSFEEKVRGFARMESRFPTAIIRRGKAVAPLPSAPKPLAVSFEVEGVLWTLDDYVARNKTAGLLVVKDEEVLVEKYGLGHSAAGRWASFSVVKSFVSTLVGAALADGAIRSFEDPVTRYLPKLKGAGYDGVTVRQLLTNLGRPLERGLHGPRLRRGARSK